MLRRWTIGLVVGLVFGVALLLTGPIGAVLGIASIALLVGQPPRLAAAAGLSIGLGTSLIVLLLRADLACGADCVGPDLTAWFGASSIVVLLGVAGSVVLLRRQPAS